MYNWNNAFFQRSNSHHNSYTRYSKICKSSGSHQAIGMPVLRTRFCTYQEVNDNLFKYIFHICTRVYMCVLLENQDAVLHYKRYFRILKCRWLTDHTFRNPALYYLKSIQLIRFYYIKCLYVKVNLNYLVKSKAFFKTNPSLIGKVVLKP